MVFIPCLVIFNSTFFQLRQDSEFDLFVTPGINVFVFFQQYVNVGQNYENTDNAHTASLVSQEKNKNY